MSNMLFESESLPENPKVKNKFALGDFIESKAMELMDSGIFGARLNVEMQKTMNMSKMEAHEALIIPRQKWAYKLLSNEAKRKEVLSALSREKKQSNRVQMAIGMGIPPGVSRDLLLELCAIGCTPETYD